MGNAVGGFDVGIAGIFFIETPQGGFESPGIGRLKWFSHGRVLCEMCRLRKEVSQLGVANDSLAPHERGEGRGEGI